MEYLTPVYKWETAKGQQNSGIFEPVVYDSNLICDSHSWVLFVAAGLELHSV